MTKTENSLWILRLNFEAGLNRIHAETLAKFRTYTRSVGQRTRLDRLK